MLDRLTILKIGGSVITDKSKILKPNISSMKNISKILKKFDRVILVHGAGSFGHYYARKYKLQNPYHSNSSKGISKTREAVSNLNNLFVQILNNHGVNTLSFPPMSIYENGKISSDKKLFFTQIIKNGLIPLTFGDIIYNKSKFRIISGDEIIKDLSFLLKPKRVIFATAVDGIYLDPKDKTSLLRELDPLANITPKFLNVKNDVTGGMEQKVSEMIEIAKNGIDVHIVNGSKNTDLIKALKGEKTAGSIIRGVKNSKNQ